MRRRPAVSSGLLILPGIIAALLVGALLIRHGRLALTMECYAIFLAGMPLGLMLHELGHFAAARASGREVTAIHIGSPPALATWRLGRVRICIGDRGSGRVDLSGRAPSTRRVLVSAAGPLASLLAAGALIPWSLHSWRVASVALGISVTGVSLLPYRRRSGQASDGLKICLLLPACVLPSRRRAEADIRMLLDDPAWFTRPDTADRLLAGYRARIGDARERRHALMMLLHRAGRFEELLRIHTDPMELPAGPSAQRVAVVHNVEYAVLTVPGIPKSAARLASQRVIWAMDNHAEPKDHMRHTLALALLRQGHAGHVEPLCQRVLAASLLPRQRATVLATIALARHALGQEPGPALDEALSLDAQADLVTEAADTLGVAPPMSGATRTQTPIRSLTCDYISGAAASDDGLPATAPSLDAEGGLV